MSYSQPNAKAFIRLYVALAVALFFFLGSGFISYSNTKNLKSSTLQTAQTHDTLFALQELASTMKDAETGQRGYILTGRPEYLEPYVRAKESISKRLAELLDMEQRGDAHFELLDETKGSIEAKFEEMERVLEAYRTQGLPAATKVIVNGHGRELMETIRRNVATMRQREQQVRATRIADRDAAYRVAVVSGLLTTVSGAVLAIILTFLMNRAMTARAREDWIKNGQSGIASAMIGDQPIKELGQSILSFFADYFGAYGGAIFVRSSDGFRRISTYGIPRDGDVPEKFDLNDGLLGQAVTKKKAFIVRDVPDGYMTIGSALGRDKPKHLIITPTLADDMVNSVIEIGFLHELDDASLELLDLVSEAIGVAVRAADYRAHLQDLLEETQRQSEELQTQSEELRVSNEELEEQSRALKESQARLEQQQTELEQTNTQLEEQTQQLESQKEELENINEQVMSKALELEKASQYKSDFLANMSHELRTPLNSSLILAKLLADNPEGNLTEEQVKFAKTIQAAGNDLLTLINDILDLSKIEAGHMDINAERMRVSRMTEDIGNIFKPLAKEKGLDFNISIAPGCPETIDTDRQRLEQIIKNLLSNAIKFTEKGKVGLLVSADSSSISFTVSDTGIGISKEQQEAIFDAFRQADGTISRKYGGTGLGLSISRELARLLGGMITLESTHGSGSSFTLTVPQKLSTGSVLANAPKESVRDTNKSLKVQTEDSTELQVLPPPFDDDREKITPNSRSLLVVEDDTAFARILYDLAQELGFLCLVAGTAEDGLNLAKRYLPSAVLLDVGLPDHSGLSVLDRLKQNTKTRHIPVHVLSANDYTQTALAMGAVGYMLKPVKRNELIDAIKLMQNHLSKSTHKVLLVEDDKIQRESVSKLLGSKDVEIVAAASAAECLEQLRAHAFDCMVLDLTLPDASGYSLLETLSREDAYSFPPVIVYTGRVLSEDEEQKLRRYSKSIIIKGAKSPERLLDEVTLFLHQVVAELPSDKQKLLKKARSRDEIFEGRRILVVEDDIRNVYSLTNILEPRGATIEIARNGQEAINALERANDNPDHKIDLVLMDVMMPVMDGLTATREIRKNRHWKKLPIIMLTAKAMKDDQERCLDAGANDYMAKPLDVEKLLSLVRVWMPR